MKHIILSALLFLTMISESLAQKSLIYGSTAADLPYKYVYLYDSDSGKFFVANIVDHKFSFSLDRPEGLKMLSLSFNTKILKTFQEVKDSPDYGYPNRSKLLAVEDSVEVFLNGKTQNAIVTGDSLNLALADMFKAIKTKGFAAYFGQYSESPVSLVFLETLAMYVNGNPPLFNRLECKLWYDKLSLTLKNSSKGKEILELLTN